MKRTTKPGRRLLQLLFAAAPLLLALAATPVNSLAQDATNSAARVSVTTQRTLTQRNNGVAGKASEDEYASLELTGKRVTKLRSTASSKTSSVSSTSPNTEFWVYSAEVDLYYDHDADGYYYGIDLWFDVDTNFAAADVYAVVYLSFEGGPWNEYAVTEDFTIFGTSGDDDYVIETELISGYPTGSYDLLIEVFDPFDGAFLASIGPADTSELAFLPLEDSDRDAPVVIVYPNLTGHGGGGSLGVFMLLMLCGVVLVQSYARGSMMTVREDSHE